MLDRADCSRLQISTVNCLYGGLRQAAFMDSQGIGVR